MEREREIICDQDQRDLLDMVPPSPIEAEFGQQPPRGAREGECDVTGIPSSIHVEPRRYHLNIPHSHILKLCFYPVNLTKD